MDDAKIITFLENLTPADFARVLVRFPDANPYVPDGISHYERVAAFMRYVRSETGPGIEKLKATIDSLPVTGKDAGITGMRAVPKGAPYFTGREDILKDLHERLQADGQVGLSQAISGLGGIGKTSAAVRYVEQYGGEYAGVLWFDASSTATLDPDYAWLARQADLPQKDEKDIAVVREAVRHYLESDWMRPNGKPFLLVFDNLDNIEEVSGMLPRAKSTCILFTSRERNLRAVGVNKTIQLEVMPVEEALQFLGNVTERTVKDGKERTAAEELIKELGGLPLALEQAANYIADEDTGCDFRTYLLTYRKRRLELLNMRGPMGSHYKETVATTFDINFQRIAEKPVAYLLHCCAFLAPDRIPVGIFLRNSAIFPSPLKEVLEQAKDDEALWRELLSPATRYGLLRYTDGSAGDEADQNTLHIHRMVQEAIRDDFHSKDAPKKGARFALSEAGETVAETTYLALAKAFPGGDFQFWPELERLLPHQRTCADRTTDYGWQTAPVAAVLHQMAFYLKEGASFEESELLYQKALQIRLLVTPARYIDITESMNNLAALYQEQGRFEEAESLLKQAVSIDRQYFGDGLAISLSNLAAVHRSLGRFDGVESLYQEANSIWGTLLPAGHPNIATGLNNLASLYHELGRLNDAECLYRQSLDIRLAALPENDPHVATSLNNFALFYQEQERYEEAESLLKQSLEIRKASLPAEHPDIAMSLNNLAALYQAQERLDEAEALYEQALDISRTALGENHPDVAIKLSNLGELYRLQGRIDSAERCCRQALDIRQRVLPKGHPDIGKSLNGLAGLCETQERFDEAELLFKQAIDILLASLGPEHKYTVTVVHNLLSMLEELQREDDIGSFVEGSPELYKTFLILLGGSEAQEGRSNHPSVKSPICSMVLGVRRRKK